MTGERSQAVDGDIAPTDDGNPASGNAEGRPVPDSDAGQGKPNPGPAAPSDADRIGELDDRWRRAVADLQNFRSRFDRELERGRVDERERVLAEWLPVVDDLERALAHADADPTSVVAGLQSILDRSLGITESLGYPRFDETDVAFDPVRHEAIATVESDDPDRAGSVAAVTRPGYGRRDRVLRPASVVVTRHGT
jgi:molecular chaperone GrpE